ncbi:3-methyladenine DNA glycosylase [Solicola sp. PLA-1-18]|uniref:3-methyladenine DNA glycosylase n=1 Tax=Solicola sp. PLA-1-18 TaxID=3380532 RepID=UPI003B7A3DE7
MRAEAPTRLRRLTAEEWQPLRDAHRRRAERWTLPHLERRRRREPHPVLDFVFEYYPYEPAKLARWHPGVDAALTGPGSEEYLALAAYRADGDAVTVDLDRLERRREGLVWARDLMVRTASRPARTDCFGLHEWAMVHRAGADGRRHASVDLRLGQDGTDAVTEAHQVRCTHVDAFRFFTDTGRPLNTLQPTRETQPAMEQPGCLHANMDLYRYAAKLAPFGDSALLLDTFELAVEIREADMRASPYDLAAWGYEPVRIETPAGKAEYVRAQRAFAERAAVLRERLIADHDRVLATLTTEDR